MRRLFLSVVGVIVCILMATPVVATGRAEQTGDARPTGGPLDRYEPPLVVTTWRGLSNRAYPDGQSFDDNVWTRAIEEQIGVVFDYVWTAPTGEFAAKINTSIAAGDLPDIMNNLNLEQYYSLSRVGRLAPQSSLVESLDVGAVSHYLDIGGGIARDMLTVGGEIYGWGRGPGLMEVRIFTARGDWLDVVGREMPTDYDSLIDLLYAFTREDPNQSGRDDTYGLAASSEFLGGGMPLEQFFGLHGSYPNIWVRTDQGLAFGATLPPTKEALRALRQLHADRVLSPEWPVLGPWTEAPDQIARGRVGAAFGQQWWHNWEGVLNTVDGDFGLVWEHIYPTSVSGEPVLTAIPAAVTSISAVNSAFGNPEVLIKLFNVHYVNALSDETAEDIFYNYRTDDGTISTFFYWNDIFGEYAIDKNPEVSRQVISALETGEDRSLRPDAQAVYENSLAYLEGLRTRDTYRNFRTFGPGGTNELAWHMLENDLFLVDAFRGPPTTAQARYAGDLRSMRNELFIQMVVGELDLDTGWNQWLRYWENNGGEEWTDQVNEWYRTR